MKYCFTYSHSFLAVAPGVSRRRRQKWKVACNPDTAAAVPLSSCAISSKMYSIRLA
jgi:hypothetical protein